MRTSISLLSFAILTGCLPAPSGPRPGAVPTGERLNIVDDVKTWTTERTVKTGERVVTNPDGTTAYTEEQYGTATDLHSKKIWFPVQGKQQINDEDLFKLTNDQPSLTATQDMHRTGRTYTQIGTVGMVVGIGAMVAARLIGNTGTLGIGLYSGGGLIGAAGAYAFWRGWEMEGPDSHAVDRSVGETDAHRYNQQLGRGASLSLVNGHF